MHVHAMCKPYPCHVYATYMPRACHVHAMRMAFTCPMHAMCMPCACHMPAGLGRRWAGVGVKAPAARRAVQLLRATLGDSAAVVFADGADAIVSNSVHHAALALGLARRDAARRGGGGRVVLSAECNSWPHCYKGEYEALAAHSACRATSPTCFVNSGAMAGSTVALLDFLSELHAAAEVPARSSERGDDQAAAHALLLAQGSNRSGGVALDAHSRLFLTLYACRGAAAAPRAFGAKRRGAGGETLRTLCHYAAHDPMRGLSINTGTAPKAFYRGSGGGGGGGGVYGSNGGSGHEVRRPFLMHASGQHERMARAFLGAAIPPASRRWAAAWQRVLPATRAVRSHPVLLVDSAAGGV